VAAVVLLATACRYYSLVAPLLLLSITRPHPALPPKYNKQKEVITLAKYTFSQGQVFVDEGIFVPILKKSRRNMESSVLLILPKRRQHPLPRKEKQNVKVHK
jgi:hypothetical protein